ncbi:ExeM/NucH family extracellular endonuclease [Chloroflexi bacterium TSY]|nr:ExeM/NucH family extracellular endonuclease [Chloroflexi bacterium TSY]
MTGSFPGLSGFYMQEEVGDQDGDPATSEGIFVFVGGTPTVAAGNIVRVLGTATDFVTSSGASPLTEITGNVTVLDCGPSATPATPVQLMLPVPSRDVFEQYEGMLVEFPQELVITEYFNFDRFGEIVLALPLDGEERPFQPTGVVEPGAAANARQAENERRRIRYDDGRTASNPDPAIHPNGNIFDLTNRFRGGDAITAATGIMDDRFGDYRIQPTQGGIYTQKNQRPAAPEDVGGRLTIATMNVLNYFTTLDEGGNTCGPNNLGCRGADNTEEFTRQRTKIIAALAGINADVVGLVEIENNATAAVQDLVNGLNDALGAGTYSFIDTGTIGTDAIKVAFIYKPATVTPVGAFAVLDSTVDARFIDTKNRPVLAQTFAENATGEKVTIVVNHLKSKGSPCDDVGDPNQNDGQGNCNGTRMQAAEALVDWLTTDPTGSGDPDFLIIGDLNAYDKEDPVDAILEGADDALGTSDDYTDLIARFQGELTYSFVFDGQFGYLDHALANESLVSQVTGVTQWHINADEPDILDFDTSFKKDAQDALYEPNAFRATDHDPIIVGLALAPPPVLISQKLFGKITNVNYVPKPIPNAPAGVVTVSVAFTNIREEPLSNLFFVITKLTRGNLLLNADGGPAGEGATLSIPNSALGDDQLLTSGESVNVDFVIGLAKSRNFRIRVDAYGSVHEDGAIAAASSSQPAIDFEITAVELGNVERDDSETQESQMDKVFLPLFVR